MWKVISAEQNICRASGDRGRQRHRYYILALDEAVNAMYRNPLELYKYIREMTADRSRQYYVLLDEI